MQDVFLCPIVRESGLLLRKHLGCEKVAVFDVKRLPTYAIVLLPSGRTLATFQAGEDEIDAWEQALRIVRARVDWLSLDSIVRMQRPDGTFAEVERLSVEQIYRRLL